MMEFEPIVTAMIRQVQDLGFSVEVSRGGHKMIAYTETEHHEITADEPYLAAAAMARSVGIELED